MFCCPHTSCLVSIITHKRTMSNRLHILGMINKIMNKIKNASSREQRFDLLDNADILAGILQEVVRYENTLMMDLDVD